MGGAHGHTLRSVQPGHPRVQHFSGPFSEQVGGTHYKDLKVQPVEYILANGLGFCEGNVVKYITRYSRKNGVEDLRKVIHYAQLLIASMEAHGDDQ